MKRILYVKGSIDKAFYASLTRLNKSFVKRGYCINLVLTPYPGREMTEEKKYFRDALRVFDVQESICQAGEISEYQNGRSASYLEELDCLLFGDTLPEARRRLEGVRQHLEQLHLKHNYHGAVIFHQFRASHLLAAELFQRLGIPFVFAEKGLLSGTLQYDLDGQMGESRITKNALVFNDLPFSEEYTAVAARLIDQARQGRLARHAPRESIDGGNLARLRKELRKSNKKLVFFAGQYDELSGILPFHPERTNTHSPFFSSSIEALEFLDKHAKRNKYHVIFKPHPKSQRFSDHIDHARTLPNTTVVGDVDVFELISAADVTVTIASQVAYLSLMAGKPIICLGKLQLEGHPAIAQPRLIEDIPALVKRAPELQYRVESFEKAFIDHCARLLQYNHYIEQSGASENSANEKFVHDFLMVIDGETKSSVLPFVPVVPPKPDIPTRRRFFFFGYIAAEKEFRKREFWLNESFPSFYSCAVLFDLGSFLNRSFIDESMRAIGMSNFRVENLGPRLFNIGPHKAAGSSDFGRWLQANDDLVSTVFRAQTARRNGLDKVDFLAALQHVGVLLDEYKISAADVIVTHAYNSLTYLVQCYLESIGCQVIFAEYGEFPDTMLVSEKGLFHESWPSLEPHKFQALQVSPDEIAQTASLCNKLIGDRTLHGHHRYSEGNWAFEEKCANFDAVIYINGIEPRSSGLYPRALGLSKTLSPYFSSNIDLVQGLLPVATRNNWLLVYKDHPAVFKNPSFFAVSGESDNLLVLGESLDLHTVLDHADVMVSLASKSIIFALIRGVPVCVPGSFTLRSNVSPGIYEGLNLEKNIKAALSAPKESRVNQAKLLESLARLLKYYLYPSAELGAELPWAQKCIHSDLADFVARKRVRVSVDDRSLKS